MILKLVIDAPAVSPNVSVAALSVMTVGLVLWSRSPVSPVTPLNVMDVVFAAGGSRTAPVAPVGGVIVLNPDASVMVRNSPGAAVFAAAAGDAWATTSPVITI